MCETKNEIGYPKEESCNRLGDIYKNVFNDSIESNKYYKEACDKGSANGCWNIGEDEKACKMGLSNGYCFEKYGY